MQKIMIFGDSYSTYKGYIPEGYACYYTGERPTPPDLTSMDETWWGKLIADMNYELIENNSWSGSTIGYTGYSGDCSHTSSFIYRLRCRNESGFFKEHKPDTVFVFGGTNDSWSNAPLGELKHDGITEADLFSVLPAISHFIGSLRQILPDAEIVVIANCDIKNEIVEALREAADKYSATYVKLSGIDKINGHPTENGMTEIKDQIKASL